MKKEEFIRKPPWGIIAGICAMAVFFLTVAVIAVCIILIGVAAQTNDTAGMFSEWYQTVMFVLDIIFFLGFVWSTVMYALREKSKKEERSKV